MKIPLAENFSAKHFLIIVSCSLLFKKYVNIMNIREEGGREREREREGGGERGRERKRKRDRER